MSYFRPQSPEIGLRSLAQMSQAGHWQLDLAHDRGEALLIWITRGQGVALLDGARRGVGAHNALYVPAHHLFALDMGRQGFGQVLVLPEGHDITLPETCQHLRIRDVAAQAELTQILEAIAREAQSNRPLQDSAITAHASLAGIWLRRQMQTNDVPAPKEDAARRLSRAFCARLTTHFTTGASMADHARALDVTPTHLTRVCKAQTGKTAARLLTERQIHAARSILRETDAPVQDIARHLGFASPAYFTRFIQHHCNAAPSQLRQARPPTA